MAITSRTYTSASSSSPSSFTALTYNILAKSLGTCAIPWLLPRPSPSLLRRVESSSAASGRSGRSWSSWEELKNGPIKDEYLRNFHKNFDSGNYAAMRSFWAAGRVQGPENVPLSLSGLEWSGEEDQVTYRRGSGDGLSSSAEGEADVVATTLRGVLRRELPLELALDLFDEISSREEGVYRWDVRGPRIFRTATELPATAGGSSSEEEPAAPLRPDLIALQEYDVHSVVAKYRGVDSSAVEESFAEAMEAFGYDGAFFKDPLRGRTPPSGLGLFWRRDTFVPASSSTELPPDSAAKEPPAATMTVIEADESALGGAFHNADLRETWHPRNRRGADDAHAPPTPMPPADRRNAALARLQHLPSGRSLLLCAVHLMTTSRDCAKTNWYPGEVRAGELTSLRELVSEKAEPGDEVLLLGDLNTDALGGVVGATPEVFGGRIRRAEGGSGSIPSLTGDILEVDTGFDPSAGSFAWDNRVLTDVFSDVHCWGTGEQGRQNCTSKNTDRTEWIDYIFQSSGLAASARSDNRAQADTMPDEVHPSDHLPLWARFEFV